MILRYGHGCTKNIKQQNRKIGMGLFSLLMNKPVMFLLLAIPLLYSVILHEVAHGLVASWFGDDTARYSGRLTLNPMAHLDPVGTLMLVFIGFGWAKPVPVNYNNLSNARLGVVSVALDPKQASSLRLSRSGADDFTGP